MSKKIPISKQTLEQLYYKEGLSRREIALILGCSETTVARRMREYGLPSRWDSSEYWKRAKLSERCRWTSEIAYAVGLIVTDGSLSPDGRHIVFTSTDYELIETFRQCLGLSNQITLCSPGGYSVRQCYRVQFGDVAFYQWLLNIGLMPNKSRRIGPLKVPDEYFADFARGHLDGDGCITTYLDDYNTFKSEKYVYQRLFLRFHSGSPKHLEWMREALKRIMGTRGAVLRTSREWALQYAKKDSLKLLRWMYYSPDVPCLERKRIIAEPWLRESATNPRGAQGVSPRLLPTPTC